MAFTALALVFFTYWVINATQGQSASVLWRNFAAAMLPDIAVTVIIYLIARQWLASRGLSESDDFELAVARRVASVISPAPGVLELSSDIFSNDWRGLLESSSNSIDVVARFFDTPVQAMGHDGIRDFLARGGKIRIAIPDPGDYGEIEMYRQQWDSGAARKGSNITSNISHRVRAGLVVVENARLAAQAPVDAVQIYTLPEINYAGYCFDRKNLILVPYALNNSIDIPPPRFHIDLGIATEVAHFWHHEWDLATSGTLHTIADLVNGQQLGIDHSKGIGR